MRVLRRGTKRAKLSSSRLKGTDRANKRWFCEKISSSRKSISASSSPSASIALRAAGSTRCIRVGVRSSRRLLRRHLFDLAGVEIEAHAVDLVEVGTGHTHEAGVIGIVDRMDGAVLINARVSGQQAVFLDRLELGVFGIGAVVLALPLDHVGVVGRLPIDRPGSAVVVRRRHPRFVVDVREDLKAEIRILVEHLQAAWHLVAAIFLDEVSVRKQLLEFETHLLPTLGSAIALENGAAIRNELIEIVGHGCLLADDVALASRIALPSARGRGLGVVRSSPRTRLESGFPLEFTPAKARGWNERSLLRARSS